MRLKKCDAPITVFSNLVKHLLTSLNLNLRNSVDYQKLLITIIYIDIF